MTHGVSERNEERAGDGPHVLDPIPGHGPALPAAERVDGGRVQRDAVGAHQGARHRAARVKEEEAHGVGVGGGHQGVDAQRRGGARAHSAVTMSHHNLTPAAAAGSFRALTFPPTVRNTSQSCT